MDFRSLMIGAAAGLLVGYCGRPNAPRQAAPAPGRVDTVEVVRVDTLAIREPVPVERVEVRRERLAITDTLRIRDTLYIEVPIEQASYHGEHYDAWVSGWHPALDSIKVYPRTIERTVTERKAAPRWSVGIQAGYGLTPKGPQPYIGLGASYNFTIQGRKR